MKLHTVIPSQYLSDASSGILFQSISQDSRLASSETIVFILPSLSGKNVQPFAEEALISAAAVITADTMPQLHHTKHIRIPEEKIPHIYALASATTYVQQPSTICGVTGSNGKTSVTYFLQQIFSALGKNSISLGTMGVMGTSIPSYLSEKLSSMTSPEPAALHETMNWLQGNGFSHLSLECSSHGIFLHRLDGVKFSTVGFTNLSQDHLDLHGTMENYFEAKARLFLEIAPKDQIHVIFSPTSWGNKLYKMCQQKGIDILKVGDNDDAVYLSLYEQTEVGMHVFCRIKEREGMIQLPLIGDFQLENLAVAIGIALCENVTPDQLFDILPGLKAAPGRLEQIEKTGILIDFAHTPDALEKTLRTLRPIAKKSLTLVFGCGGDRDKEKRTLMGGVAQQWADHVIVTDDNPRTENPAEIRHQILKACPKGVEIGDRYKAIQQAIERHEQGNILLIAGKGHEKTQTYGTVARPFSDKQCVEALLGGKA